MPGSVFPVETIWFDREHGSCAAKRSLRKAGYRSMIRITIDKNDAEQRLDRFLRKYLHNAPLSVIYKMIRKDVKLNGRRAEQKTLLREGDELSFYISEEQMKSYTEKIARQPSARRTFRVIYEDQDLLIVNKPGGLLTHGDAKEKKNTLLNQVTDYLIQKGEYVPGKEKSFSPAAANRLDRNTSGMVVFGKNAEALRTMAAMIREKDSVGKYYLTVVRGEFREHTVLTGRAEKDETANKVKILKPESENGQFIETEVHPLVSRNGMTLLEIHLITGRTHQIRAHLAAEGFPIVGDAKYGERDLNRRLASEYGLQSQFLHAYRLKIRKAYGVLSGLQGRSFIDPLPAALEGMADRLFGKGWKTVYGQDNHE